LEQLLYKLNDKCVISTIYAEDIELYETMLVCENDKYILANRYKTEEEAINGHLEVIENMKNGKVYDGKDEIFDNDPLGCVYNFLKCFAKGDYER